MRDKPFYELLSRIDEDSLLANFFNKVLGNLMKIADIALIFFMIHACGKCIFINSYTS